MSLYWFGAVLALLVYVFVVTQYSALQSQEAAHHVDRARYARLVGDTCRWDEEMAEADRCMARSARALRACGFWWVR